MRIIREARPPDEPRHVPEYILLVGENDSTGNQPTDPPEAVARPDLTSLPSCTVHYDTPGPPKPCAKQRRGPLLPYEHVQPYGGADTIYQGLVR